jgi:hypothetical protein
MMGWARSGVDDRAPHSAQTQWAEARAIYCAAGSTDEYVFGSPDLFQNKRCSVNPLRRVPKPAVFDQRDKFPDFAPRQLSFSLRLFSVASTPTRTRNAARRG